ncbi:rRNA methyltransferase [bacterium]|nr:rRNA methyltransferase [bacterium]
MFSSALNENAVNYDQLDYQQNVVLIIGNEKDGVSKLVIKNSDYLIKIPMFNNVDSLNVSVATGILLFNIISKRKNKGFI